MHCGAPAAAIGPGMWASMQRMSIGPPATLRGARPTNEMRHQRTMRQATLLAVDDGPLYAALLSQPLAAGPAQVAAVAVRPGP